MFHSKLFSRITGCYDSAGLLCPGTSRRLGMLPDHYRDADHYADVALYRHPSSIVTVAPGQPVSHYRVCTDPPVMGMHSCRTADSTTLPAAVTTAALTAVPAIVAGQAPAIIEITKLPERNNRNA